VLTLGTVTVAIVVEELMKVLDTVLKITDDMESQSVIEPAQMGVPPSDVHRGAWVGQASVGDGATVPALTHGGAVPVQIRPTGQQPKLSAVATQ